MTLFIDTQQFGRINQAQTNANDAKLKADQLAVRLADLERRVDRSALAAQAQWEILRERLGLSDDVVFDKMAEIDLRDGVADGKIRPQIMKCSTCGRPINSTRPKCIYCGQVSTTEHIVQ